MIATLLVVFQIFIFGEREEAYWDWQLTSPHNLDIKVKVLALDPIDHDRDAIIALRKRGVKPVCYISIGTWEPYRDDKGDFPAAVLGKPLESWPDEIYLDVRATEVLLPIMEGRIKECADKGFKAVELDNMDVSDNPTGFGITSEQSLIYIRQIAALARENGLEVAQKNSPELVKDLVDEMDFIIVESCYRYNFCDMIMPYTAAGKDVLAVEYEANELEWDAVCEDAKRRGFKLLLKDWEVTAGGKACK